MIRTEKVAEHSRIAKIIRISSQLEDLVINLDSIGAEAAVWAIVDTVLARFLGGGARFHLTPPIDRHRTCLRLSFS